MLRWLFIKPHFIGTMWAAKEASILVAEAQPRTQPVRSRNVMPPPPWGPNNRG